MPPKIARHETARHETSSMGDRGLGSGPSGVVNDGHRGMLEMWCKRIERAKNRSQGTEPAGEASQSEGLTGGLGSGSAEEGGTSQETSRRPSFDRASHDSASQGHPPGLTHYQELEARLTQPDMLKRAQAFADIHKEGNDPRMTVKHCRKMDQLKELNGMIKKLEKKIRQEHRQGQQSQQSKELHSQLTALARDILCRYPQTVADVIRDKPRNYSSPRFSAAQG